MKYIFTGKDLSINDLVNIARENIEVELDSNSKDKILK